LTNATIGGRLKYFVQNWKKFTSDKFILETVSGFKIKFDDEVIPYRRQPLNFNSDECAIVREQISKLVEKGVVVTSQHEPDEIISSVFLRKKKAGVKYRMILNLKPLNHYVEYHHFKMDSLETAKMIVRPNCYMGSVDLSDAYFCVPIHDSHRKYVKFLFEGILYEFTALPQGLACAPRLFTKILKPFYAKMREKGYQCMGYIDDSFIMGNSYEECKTAIDDIEKKFPFEP